MNWLDLKREAASHVIDVMGEPMIYQGRGYPAIAVCGLFMPLETQVLSGDTLVDSTALWFEIPISQLVGRTKPAHGDKIIYSEKSYVIREIQPPVAELYRFRCHEEEGSQYGTNQR
jgi:hypothetical protein